MLSRPVEVEMFFSGVASICTVGCRSWCCPSFLPVSCLGPVSTKLLHQRRLLNHFYVEPPECFHRAFAWASKSALDATDASTRNYNLDARVNADAKAWWKRALRCFSQLVDSVFRYLQSERYCESLCSQLTLRQVLQLMYRRTHAVLGLIRIWKIFKSHSTLYAISVI